ncbi:hypothetical protein [Microvirga sp. VF16]|uniref:hypothetical protein n=1 Tax=Microvirga sp. VF16 TaxID=2807101 RepID=UPI00193E1804|nr:hypothetical protein [Microvirga sp. VF16]QRM34129.1 hypothetical protein JO965_33230 [Microvirga sp. VF16]
MQVHRFAVGEIVLCAEKRHPHFTWKAPYTVLACIQSEAAEPQYQIASGHRHEIRMAGEHELCRTPQPLSAFRQSREQLLDALSCLEPANLNLTPGFDDALVPRPQHPDIGGHHV